MYLHYKNVKITNKCNDFKLSVVAESIQLNNKKDGKGKIELRATITELKSSDIAKISNANVTFEAHSNWTTKTDAFGSSSSFNSGNTLTPGSEWNVSSTLNLGTNYPVKVIPLILQQFHPVRGFFLYYKLIQVHQLLQKQF